MMGNPRPGAPEGGQRLSVLVVCIKKTKRRVGAGLDFSERRGALLFFQNVHCFGTKMLFSSRHFSSLGLLEPFYGVYVTGNFSNRDKNCLFATVMS